MTAVLICRLFMVAAVAILVALVVVAMFQFVRRHVDLAKFFELTFTHLTVLLYHALPRTYWDSRSAGAIGSAID